MITKCQRCGSRDITWRSEDYYRCNTCGIYARIINQKLLDREVPIQCTECGSEDVVGMPDIYICRSCGSTITEKKLRNIKRRIYKNYDAWMYSIHDLQYGILIYKNVKYNCDVQEDRYLLVLHLLNDGVIELEESINKGHFRFKKQEYIHALKRCFHFYDRDNANMSIESIVLNLSGIYNCGFTKGSSKDFFI